MKRIGIVTFHRANNYGAVLQAYALQSYIDKYIARCEIVDYRSDFLFREYHYILKRNTSLRKMMTSLLNYPIRCKINKSFDDFRKRYLVCSDKTYSDSTVAEADDEYDQFVFGSDQIWNYKLNNYDYNYLGSFVSDDNKLNSYAASFGFDSLRDDLVVKYSEYLKRFKNIAVREESGCKIIKKTAGKASVTVCDPVLLLEDYEWDMIASDKKSEGKYIFLYHLQGNNTELNRYAKYLSEHTGLPVIDFQAWVKPRPRCFKPVFGGSPEDFLGWIKDTEYVITDSFHCTAFSIIFKKKFWSGIDRKKDIKATRAGNLLYSLNLSSRILPEALNEWNFNEQVDYEVTEEKKLELINTSKEYLISVLDEKCVR